jgi:hypothetical protein
MGPLGASKEALMVSVGDRGDSDDVNRYLSLLRPGTLLALN